MHLQPPPGKAAISNVNETTCCIVGGGPAGMMLGYLLARRGVRVTVLEKHNDFFRDFRGDTVHPSTLAVLHELGLLDDFLKLPHQEVRQVGIVIGDERFEAADVSHVPGPAKFVALMPQWDFLNFLAERAKRFDNFELRMNHAATGLHFQGDRVTGVIVKTPDSESSVIRAELTVGCDGRHAMTRQAAGLEVMERGVPIDVLWFRLSRLPSDPGQVFGNVNYGKMLILIDRADYYQAGFIIRKGTFDAIKEKGLDAFHEDLRRIAPFLGSRVEEITDWDQVKILTVQINRLRQWYREGLLCIGDAAHAMSPVGGVGINLAIQDAVAAANRLAEPLLRHAVTTSVLQSIQCRREFPTRVTQGFQTAAHGLFKRVYSNPGPFRAPLALRAVVKIPGIHQALGYAVGIGVRPEHVEDQQASKPRPSRIASAIAVAVGTAVGVAVAITILRRVRRAR